MEILFLIIGAIALFVLVLFFMKQAKGFDDPKPMTNEQLLSAIAGQADWIEKMRAAPIESQKSQSIVELARKRRSYIARLCLEVLSRDFDTEGQLKYPGATRALSIFSEAAQYAKKLEANGDSRENAAVQAVKEKLFVANGAIYPSRWEV